jgi:signal transduction histidine kinase
MLHRHHPPPVRVEWLIGGTRVVLAFAALLDVWVDSASLPHLSRLVFPCLFYYLAYSIAMVALIWKPVSVTRGWIIAVHMFDVVAVALFVSSAAAPNSPVLLYFVFILICATLRWGPTGALWTAAGSIALFAAAWAYGVMTGEPGAFDVDQLVRRSVHFCGAAALIGYLGTYSHPLHSEMSRLALWPRKLPRTRRALVSDIIAQACQTLESPAVVLVWMAPNDRRVNLAWQSDEGVVWTHEPSGTYGTLVAPELARQSFQAFDATKDNARVIHWSAGRLRSRRCRPLNEQLRARFAIRTVQSCRLEGEFIQGRLFSFGKDRMQIDDLIVGDLVARLAVGQLDRMFLVTQMGESAASEERLRVARDLHDNLAQTLAGTALQLRAARRLLDFDPATARSRFEEVQYQLKRDQLEVRSMIRRLRPSSMPAPQYPPQDEVGGGSLQIRLHELQLRIQKQWDVGVEIHLDIPAGDWPDAVAEEVFRLIQEAALNAARHAEASVIRVEVTANSKGLQLAIEDDGKGYPFHGSFDLPALSAMEKGPLTLRERVAALGGNLQLETSSAGTRVVMTLSNARVGV